VKRGRKKRAKDGIKGEHRERSSSPKGGEGLAIVGKGGGGPVTKMRAKGHWKRRGDIVFLQTHEHGKKEKGECLKRR